MRSPPPTSTSRAGWPRRVLVIGAETFSRILDWSDRSTCVLFGDGAGALVLEAEESAGAICRPRHHRVEPAFRRRAQGQALRRRRAVDHRHGRASQDGRPRGVQACGRHDHRRHRGDVAQAGVTAEDLDWFVPHQANKRIIDASAKKLDIAEEKVVTTVQLHGNTSAASVPLALSVAVADGRIKTGRSRAARSHGRRLHLGRGAAALVAHGLNRRSHTEVQNYPLPIDVMRRVRSLT